MMRGGGESVYIREVGKGEEGRVREGG